MANPALLLDYFFVQPILVGLLQEALPQLPVRAIDSLATATDNDVRDCVAYVLFEGERFTDKSGNAMRNMVRHRYSVMLGIEHKRQNDEATGNAQAGKLLSKMHLAIAGKTHEQLVTRTFERTSGRSPIYTPGAALYPLTFEILVNL